MVLFGIIDLSYLFLLGLVGWAFFSLLRLPVAPFLGTLFFLVTLRTIGLEIPYAPSWLLPFLQVLLGIYVGSMVTRKTILQLKPMILPVVVIIVWAQSLVFVIGPLLSRVLSLDLFSTMLGFSLTGLAEVSIIALEVNAELGFIILMQLTRMIITIFLLPFIFVKWAEKSGLSAVQTGLKGTSENFNEDCNKSTRSGVISKMKETILPNKESQEQSIENNGVSGLSRNYFSLSNLFILIREKHEIIVKILFILLAAFLGGYLLAQMGIPAGFMVGSIIMVSFISLTLEKSISISPRLFNFLLLGLGVTVADQMSPENLATLADKQMLIIVLISTIFIFSSSFLVAFILSRLTRWDLQTCYLAAAPAGFFIMVVLAVKYNKDPFFVSMLHLFRLLSIKLIIPFVITWL